MDERTNLLDSVTLSGYARCFRQKATESKTRRAHVTTMPACLTTINGASIWVSGQAAAGSTTSTAAIVSSGTRPVYHRRRFRGNAGDRRQPSRFGRHRASGEVFHDHEDFCIV